MPTSLDARAGYVRMTHNVTADEAYATQAAYRSGWYERGWRAAEDDGGYVGEDTDPLEPEDVLTAAGGMTLVADGFVQFLDGEIVLTCDFTKTVALVAGTPITLGTLGTGYRPPTGMWGTTRARVVTPDSWVSGGIRVDHDGVIDFTPDTAHASGAMTFEAHGIRIPISLS